MHTEFLLLFENATLLREILTWGRESSRQEQDLKILQVHDLKILQVVSVKQSNVCDGRGEAYYFGTRTCVLV
jgi:hypothetical protein